MKILNGHQVVTGDFVFMVGYHKEHRSVPIGCLPSLVKKLPKGIIGIPYHVIKGILGLSMEIYSSVGKFKGRMVGYREYHCEKRLISMSEEFLLRAVKDIFVRESPGAMKNVFSKVLFVNHSIETISQEKTLHVVKLAIPSVDELCGIPLPLEETGQREEALL